MEQIKKELPELKKKSDTFKIVVPVEVEEKIRHLCRCCPTVEWSGKLFYRTEGSIVNKDLVITCVDLYVMDIGTGGYTEFTETPNFFGYMVDKDLMDCNIGLIHSHNQMNTFFSGTDTQTLREEGNDNNHFVSLIVNNAGTYTAAVTRKVTTVMDVVATKSFRTFDDSEVKIEGEDKWEQEFDTIEYYMLDVDKAEVPNVFNELDKRLNEIRAAKSKPSVKNIETYSPKFPNMFEGHFDRFNNRPLMLDTTVDAEKPNDDFEDIASINEELELAKFEMPDSMIDRMALQIITGSITLTDTSRIDLVEFSKNNMESLFNKRFPDWGYEGYELWLDNYLDFLIKERIPDGLSVDAENEAERRILSALYDKLTALPNNNYLTIIIEIIQYRMS